jgi:Na+/H+-dicarboxylate symporter
MTSKVYFSPKLGAWALGALGVAVVLGLFGRANDVAWVFGLSERVEPLGVVWLNALQMTVIPLIVTQLLAALVRPDAGASVGKLGGQAFGLFVTMLLVGSLLTVAFANPVIATLEVSPDLVAGVRLEAIPEAARVAAQQPPTGVGEWLISLFPANPMVAFVEGNLIQILVFTILVGLAISRLDDPTRIPLAKSIHGLSEAMMMLIGWVLWGTSVSSP